MAFILFKLALKDCHGWAPPTFSVLSFSPIDHTLYILAKLVCMPGLKCALNFPFPLLSELILTYFPYCADSLLTYLTPISKPAQKSQLSWVHPRFVDFLLP